MTRSFHVIRSSGGRELIPLAILYGLVALCLSGCSSTGFQSSVGQFGKLTSAASADQAASLLKITREETERIRADLASSRADLRLKASCGLAIGLIPVPEPRVNQGIPPCEFVRRDGIRLEEAPRFTNIIALSVGLDGYARSLVELASDHDDDNRAFSSSVTGLATSLGGLDASVRKATGASQGDSSAKMGAIASLVAEAGELYFSRRRNAALRKIIIAADPLVQDATKLLSEADDRIGLYDRSGLAEDLIAAQKHQSEIAGSAPIEELRRAQDRMYDLLGAFTQRSRGTERFVAIGEAHAKLANAAREGARPAELKKVILALIHLAGTIDTTADAFGNDAQEPADAS